MAVCRRKMLSKRSLIFGLVTDLEATHIVLPHPLHVGITPADILKVKCLEETLNDVNFIGMISVLHIGEEKNKLFVNVTSIDVETNETDENFVKLYVSKVFLEHYRLQFGITVHFKAVYPVSLDKVVIGVKTKELYEYTKQQKWATELLLSVCKNKVLVRAKDVWLAGPHIFNVENKKHLFDIITLDCYPVSQGIFDVKTSIIIVKTSSHITKQPSLDIKRACNLLRYTFPYIVHSPKLLYKPMVPSNSIFDTTANKFNVEIIPQLAANLKNGIDIDGDMFHPSDAIFISKRCMNSFKLSEGSWVMITFMSCGDRKLCHNFQTSSNDVYNGKNENDFSNVPVRHRITRVFSIEKWLYEGLESIEKRNVIFMSPLLWFNLNNHPSPLLQPTAEVCIEPLPIDFVLPYASEVHISLVQSPGINGTMDCDYLRKHYFRIPRIVCSGDVLAVGSSADIKFREKMEAQDTRLPVVYFKISLINSKRQSSCFLVDNSNTSIYQAGTKQSYIPATMEGYFSHLPIHPLWEVPRPAAFAAYVDNLQAIVSPYLRLENTHHQINPHILLMGEPGCGKTTVVKSLCRSLNMHLYLVNCYDLVGGMPGSSDVRVKKVFERALMYAPCVLVLRNIEVIGKMKDSEDPRILNSFYENLKTLGENFEEWPVIVVATSTKAQLQNSELFSMMLHHVYIEVPSEAERKLLLRALFSTCSLANHVSLSYISKRTAGFVLGDLTALFVRSLMAAFNRLKQITDLTLTWKEEVDVSYAGICVLQSDVINALEELQSIHAQSVGAPVIPNVNWEDVGGLEDVKQEILDTIQLPLKHPELLNAGLRRSGVLLYGPPGTGKTLLAKAVATECCLNFLSVKGPELINMYVGQSEENVRDVFDRARSATPCVIFFDELDSLAPSRGRSGDSCGVMDRVVSQLLAELDGLSKSTDVFVIGATNRPDLLDTALLRPGRFDRLVHVGIPNDTDSRLKILKAISHKIPLSKDVSLQEIENKCPMNLSGADFYLLCSNALMNAIGRGVQRLENGESEADVELMILQEDFDVAVSTLVPSVSSEELSRFDDIKRNVVS